ncbi:MAG: 16S rRNA (adenine(1518)-N(6)/adenine(1519)-N(6))-dimethyltransferase RsmA [Actinomycetota bacterium]|nr:16S rRNA (adenine(1518)-N(6)/adenine(1519)-N(6))-dimethyltransferase RsmA [Actinomycetota bacterium]MDQ2958518.1 16S rRNA (adenine(1518)-N(6)/adenine(1519)-N(6))-dimethyltransferase RsmA [Actinomycetota bacterium]
MRDVDTLLGPVQVRELAERLQIRPTKTLGQNFVHDPNTIRRIVREAALAPDESVLEVGPGLGSLTLGLLAASGHLTAVEIDARLAAELPLTVAGLAPSLADRLTVLTADALGLTELPDPQPTALVANLPYNISVPVLLNLLAAFPTIRHGLVLVQLEVADRLAAPPGSKVYGVPSAKLAWYGPAKRVGVVPRSVFWPVPNVESGLVHFTRGTPPVTSVGRERVFAVIDAAFAQRRKMLRSVLAGLAGSPAAAQAALVAAGVDPTARGETIDVAGFARIAAALAP